MRSLLLLSLASLLIVASLACGAATYRPIYYPDRSDLTTFIKGPEFSSIEEAREWVNDQGLRRGDRDWDYEIGKNCKSSNYGVDVCEETVK